MFGSAEASKTNEKRALEVASIVLTRPDWVCVLVDTMELGIEAVHWSFKGYHINFKNSRLR